MVCQREMNKPGKRRRAATPISREEAKHATRAALIAAGLAEFQGRGLDASLDSICERAGLTRGAFYVHFADRDAFIVAVMEHVLGGFVTALAMLTAQPGGVARMIAMYFEAVRSRAPAVSGGSGLRMQHLMEACRRSAVRLPRTTARLDAGLTTPRCRAAYTRRCRCADSRCAD